MPIAPFEPPDEFVEWGASRNVSSRYRTTEIAYAPMIPWRTNRHVPVGRGSATLTSIRAGPIHQFSRTRALVNMF
jgi:hypothetical protein